YPGAVRDRLRDVEIEAGDHGEVGEGRALHHDRVDGVQYQRCRHDSARFHLVQHPGGGDAAFGGIEHEHPADIALAGELMIGARKYAAHAIEIVARREADSRDQRRPAPPWHHAGHRKENLAAHFTQRSTLSLPSYPAAAARGIDAGRHGHERRLITVAADDVDELCRIRCQPPPTIRLRHFPGVALVEAHAG